MTEQRTHSTSGESSTTGEHAGDRDRPKSTHAANQRVEKLRGGLVKAVSGREHVIKAQALSWAEKLDERTQGRHHNKLHVALRVIEFVVDNAAKGRAQASEADGRGQADADRPQDTKDAGRDGAGSASGHSGFGAGSFGSFAAGMFGAAAAAAGGAAGPSASSSGASGADDAEDLGEFRNVTDEARRG